MCDPARTTFLLTSPDPGREKGARRLVDLFFRSGGAASPARRQRGGTEPCPRKDSDQGSRAAPATTTEAAASRPRG